VIEPTTTAPLGAMSPEQVRQNVAGLRQAIPTELWPDPETRGLPAADTPI
jgi:hypothetical protein